MILNLNIINFARSIRKARILHVRNKGISKNAK